MHEHLFEDILIINDTGALLYHWHPKIEKKEEKADLLSGFLTAIDNFAKVERGEDIKSLKLRETLIIFEKSDENIQSLTFVITSKNDELIELLHSFIHDIKDRFTNIFSKELNKKFDGEVTKFQEFDKYIKQIVFSHGLDILDDAVRRIDNNEVLKSIILIEPKSGSNFFIHAKQYINKEKLSFLIPLIINSGYLLYQNNLNEKLRWILINTVQNENLLVEPRNRIIIVKQYKLIKNFEEDFLSLDFFNEKEKYIRKPKKLSERFEAVEWDSSIKQVYLVDLLGKVFYSKVFDSTYDCSDYIPETIGYLTSSKKISEEIYSRVLFNAAIGGEKIATICINFNNFALILIGNVNDFSDFASIQNLCIKIYRQLI
ncbi:MAG: hypothetical protein ACFE85_04815 [Candidatus Hodarchaeota archaeon]